MINFYLKKYLPIVLATLLLSNSSYAAVSQDPLFLVSTVDPNVLFNMSVEKPMGGAAYNDQPDGDCGGRVNDNRTGTVGICYFPTKKYLGYFDANKCYSYSSDHYTPEGPTNSNHECSGQFSGNFLNWASMTAMDMFVWTMTGGNRVDDGADTTTIIERTRQSSTGDWFPYKLISTSHNVAPSTVTPYDVDKLYITPSSFGIIYDGTYDGTTFYRQTHNVKVRVCQESKGLEENCVPYDGGNYYKPEGLIQKNADRMRFAVTSYTNTDGDSINGGVLRSNMKYVGTTMPDGSGGTIPNPEAEILADGTIDTNANAADATASGVSYSGIITYLNKFSRSGYKNHDPASELFYESIRYYKNLGPTAEYLTGNNGGFPILDASRWQDPIQHWCQGNFIIGMNDANPWMDKRLPGTFFTSNTFSGRNISQDYGEPSTPDPDINVKELTNTVGDIEGLNNSDQCIGCTANDCDMAASVKRIGGLGEVFGTCPYTEKDNSYYIAGLAYYANTQDIRKGTGGATALPGKQTISTFMIDSQEYSETPLIGRTNMLWLAGKYGGFIDSDAPDNPPADYRAEPNLVSEWDSNKDGEPDNYVLASQPEKLVEGLNRAFQDIEARTSSAAGIASNSRRLDTSSKIYQARFDSGDWTGELIAYPIITVDDPDTTENEIGQVGSQAWNAGDTSKIIPTGENNRNVLSYDPTTSSGIDFEYTNLNASQKLLLTSDQVDYLRGDKTKEEQEVGGVFRNRTSLMGDIINSDPWYAGKVEDLGYSNLPDTEGTDYAAYKISKLSRTPALYFGANDGLFHAIDADSGVELFSYVPDTIMNSIGKLTDPNYGCGSSCTPHSFFVDGAPKAGDAYIDTGDGHGDSWHSVLIGTLGAGGKGFFALDITDPSSFSASEVMWEISTTQAPNTTAPSIYTNHLGYTFPQASVVRMHNGKWAAIVANGYESASKTAALFIINVETGEIINDIINTGVGDATTPNGLSTPFPLDEDGDNIVDSIYAGDLLGNLWKFDVSSSNPNNWDVAFTQGPNKYPLFSATDANNNPQPITSKPQVGRHPDGGLMVYFGTGKYFAVNDQIVGNSPQVQTFYGIRDQGNKIDNGRSALQEQTILHEETISSLAKDLRVTSNSSVDYSSKKGWFMDLVSPNNGPEGERVISNPILRSGRIIFTTMTPDSDPCKWGGTGWLMEINAVNGKRLATSPFDINNDGKFDKKDLSTAYDADGDGSNDNVEVSGTRDRNIGIFKTPGIVITEDGTETKYVSGSSGKVEVIKESAGDPFGRQSWRQLR